jgi:AraC-like DNA-binding protein
MVQVRARSIGAMPSIPLPFVLAFLLLILFIRLTGREEGTVNRPFLALVATALLQQILIGLRYGCGLENVRAFQPLLASLIPPLAWLGFSHFATAHAARWVNRVRPHMLAPLAIVALKLAAPLWIDPVLVLTYLGYGTALLVLARSGPDGLDRASLEGAIPLHRALQVSGVVLILSALIDTAIALDFLEAKGAHAGLISGIASLCFITFLGAVAAIAGRRAPSIEGPDAEPAAPSTGADPGDVEIVARLDEMMRAKLPHHDPELTLARLARKMTLPARRISSAVNRVRGLNVSQYVNEHRIADACRLLRETDMPVTQILFGSGFLTKSNFNREFRRVTGTSPSAWRAGQRQARPEQPAKAPVPADG